MAGDGKSIAATTAPPVNGLTANGSSSSSSTGSDAAAGAPPRAVAKRGLSVTVRPGQFEPEKHFYPRVLNAQIHPLVSSFMHLGNERIITRYCHLNPQLSTEYLREMLSYKPVHFFWAGSDLFNVTTLDGKRQMICIETNSCPSGNKSMPLLSDQAEFGGYQIVLERSFKDLLLRADPSLGGLAVMYDKNPMEASGYAAVLAEISKEPVHLVECYDADDDLPIKWVGGVLHVRTAENNEWCSIRAAFRYVTQRPWQRIPVESKTIILNSIISCLAGGRNKSMAAKAYELFNRDHIHKGLYIRTPDTKWDVSKNEIRLAVELLGGHAVIKVPYANAGQGVYTITQSKELEAFMAESQRYDRFIVQSLVGNASWSSQSSSGKYFHVGTIPDKKLSTYVADLRMMVCASSHEGFQPVAIYARRAEKPLLAQPDGDPTVTTWDMLGTNLSVKDENGNWTTATNRLLLMDRKDFNSLGLGVDDLIDAYVQTCLSVIAIDKMCQRLMPDNRFDLRQFELLNPDESLMREIMTTAV